MTFSHESDYCCSGGYKYLRVPIKPRLRLVQLGEGGYGGGGGVQHCAFGAWAPFPLSWSCAAH